MKKHLLAIAPMLLIFLFSSVICMENIDYNLEPIDKLTQYYQNLSNNPPKGKKFIDNGQIHFAIKSTDNFKKILSKNNQKKQPLQNLMNNFEETLINIQTEEKKTFSKLNILLSAADKIEKTDNRKKTKTLPKIIIKKPRPKLTIKTKNLKRRRKNDETPEDETFFPMRKIDGYCMRPRKKKRKTK